MYFILAKTHKATIFLNAPHPTTIGALKTQALSALSQFAETTEDDFPKATALSDFEICRAKRDRRTGTVIEYDVLDDKALVNKELENWEVVYFRFRNEAGELQDVYVEEPPEDDYEPSPGSVPLEDIKGKRKEPPS